MVNLENTSGKSMKDGILNDAFKTVRAENAIMNKELKDEMKSTIANLKVVGQDDKFNDQIEGAERSIKNAINDELEEIINDETIDKKLENLTKNAKHLKTRNKSFQSGMELTTGDLASMK